MSAPIVDGISGAVGGIIATLATYPLMTLSTRQAVARPLPHPTSEPTTSTPMSTTVLPSRTSTTNRWSWDRVVSLYDGLFPTLVGTAASQGVYFYLYELVRVILARARGRHPRSPSLSVPETLLIAALAGCGNVLVTNPIWVLIVRIQTARRKKQSTRGAHRDDRSPEVNTTPSSSTTVSSSSLTLTGSAVELWRESGFKGFYRGLLPTLVMVINPTLQYVLLEWLLAQSRGRSGRSRPSSLAQGRNGPKKLTSLQLFALSALAKAGATVLTYPMLVVKTRVNAQRVAPGQARDVKSTWGVTVDIAREQGVPGFFQGLHTKIVQSVTAAALLYMIKEDVKAVIQRSMRNESIKSSSKST